MQLLGNFDSLASIAPELVLFGFMVLAMLGAVAWPKREGAAASLISVTGLGIALGWLLVSWRPGLVQATFQGSMANDPLGLFFKGYLIFAAIIVLLASLRSSEVSEVPQGEYFALLLAVTGSACLLATAADLLMIYLALEMVSVSSYVLVGFSVRDRKSNEASLKYLLFGGAASGVMLYGMAILYGLTGSTNVHAIREALAHHPAAGNHGALMVATLFVLAGFGFKMAAAPFHFWCPDVYQGAPTPITAYLSVAPKAAGFALLIRFFFPAATGPLAHNVGSLGETVSPELTAILVTLCLVTMTLGNLAALTQRNMKRLLAYSSIAHAGYMLMGALLLSYDGARAILVYLLVYLFMNVGAFLVVIAVYDSAGSFDIPAYDGLYRRNPWLAFAMTIFLLSLIGFPPLAGFMGKLYLFLAVLKRGFITVAVVAALNSVVAVFYYVRVIRAMVIDPGEEGEPLRVAPLAAVLIGLLTIPNVLLIVVWPRVDRLASRAASILGSYLPY